MNKSPQQDEGKNMINKRLYNIWSCMKQRCNNPKHTAARWYYEKGISVCDEWRDSFEAFQKWAIENDYFANGTIDRINSDKGYCPQNCRWVTREENCKNAKKTITNRQENKKTEKKEYRRTGRFMVVQFPVERGWKKATVIKTGLTKPEACSYIREITRGKEWMKRYYSVYVTEKAEEGWKIWVRNYRTKIKPETGEREKK